MIKNRRIKNPDSSIISDSEISKTGSISSLSDDIRKSISKESLTIEVTTICNSSCTHCFAHAGLASRISISLSDAKSILQEGFELGFRSLHITGGEPLMWEHLSELLNDAFSAGYKSIFINT